jgi:hypothetical protein
MFYHDNDDILFQVVVDIDAWSLTIFIDYNIVQIQTMLISIFQYDHLKNVLTSYT